MKLIGLMPVKNEDWVLGLSLRAAAMFCDQVLVFLHNCTDRSTQIVFEAVHEGANIHVITENEQTWHEMEHRNRMLLKARELGGTHFAMIDADEVLTGNLLPTIRQTIEALQPGSVLQLPWLALPRSTGRYLTSGTWASGQNVTTAFKDDPRWHWTSETRGGYDFHQRHPMVHGGHQRQTFLQPLKPHQGGLMHLQFLSGRRLRAKQALYQMTEVLRWPGRKRPQELAQMYGLAVYDSDPAKHQTAECPADWWAPYAGLMGHLEIDAEPWQERECKRLVAEHGRDKFRGLDLFGVV